MTTGSRAGEEGDRIEVAHDPRGRLDPRPAASVGDPYGKLRWGAGLFGVGVLLRLLSELGMWPFRGAEYFDGPLEWRWRAHWRRRRFRPRS